MCDEQPSAEPMMVMCAHCGASLMLLPMQIDTLAFNPHCSSCNRTDWVDCVGIPIVWGGAWKDINPWTG